MRIRSHVSNPRRNLSYHKEKYSMEISWTWLKRKRKKKDKIGKRTKKENRKHSSFSFTFSLLLPPCNSTLAIFIFSGNVSSGDEWRFSVATSPERFWATSSKRHRTTSKGFERQMATMVTDELQMDSNDDGGGFKQRVAVS